MKFILLVVLFISILFVHTIALEELTIKAEQGQ